MGEAGMTVSISRSATSTGCGDTVDQGAIASSLAQ